MMHEKMHLAIPQRQLKSPMWNGGMVCNMQIFIDNSS